MPSTPETPGARIKRLRAERKWSLARLARESGIEKGTIGRIELGKQSPHASTVNVLIAALTRPSEVPSDGQKGSTNQGGSIGIEDHLGAVIAHIRTLSAEDRSKFVRAITALLDALEHARPAASSGSVEDHER